MSPKVNDPIAPKTLEELTLEAAVEYECCKRSFYYFLSTHVKTQDQRDGKIKPFPAHYPYIKEICEHLEGQDNLIILKARQLTTSWLFCAYALWRILYHSNFSIKMLSKKGESVSDGTCESLFGKIDFIHSHLPKYLQQTISSTGRPMRRMNPNNGSYISGEATVSDAGRGGTFSEVLEDEHAFQENDDAIQRSIGMAAERIISWSTPNGEQGVFYDLYTSPNNGFKKLCYDWRVIPEHNDEWFANKTRFMKPEDIARELQCSFKGSVAGKIFPIDEQKHIMLLSDVQIQEEILEDQRRAAFDMGNADGYAYLMGYLRPIPSGVQLYIYADYYSYMDGSTEEKTIPEVAAQYHKDAAIYKCSEIVNVADPSGRNRTATGGASFFKLFQQQGIILQPGNNDVELGITLIIQLLKEGKLLFHPRCQWIVKCLQNAAYPVDHTGRPKSKTYHHNQFSHALDALRYLVLSIPDFNAPEEPFDGSAYGEEYKGNGGIGLG